MNEVTFWSAFFWGVLTGLIGAFVLSAVATVAFLIVAADQYIERDALTLGGETDESNRIGTSDSDSQLVHLGS